MKASLVKVIMLSSKPEKQKTIDCPNEINNSLLYIEYFNNKN